MLSAVKYQEKNIKKTRSVFILYTHYIYALHTMARQIHIIFLQGTLGIAPPKVKSISDLG